MDAGLNGAEARRERWAHWPRQTESTYYAQFYGAMRAHGVIPIANLELTSKWLASRQADVIHIHWPEGMWRQRGKGAIARIRGVRRVRQFLTAAKDAGLSVVWTAHNLGAHEGGDRIEARGYAVIARLADLIICHSNWSAEQVRRTYQPPGSIVVMPIGNADGFYPATRSREEVLAEFGMDPSRPVVSCLGILRAYKGLDTACDAAAKLGTEAQLLIGGPVFSKYDLRAIRESIARLPNAKLVARRLTDQEFADLMSASDATLLPYHNVTTSSAMIASWTLGTGIVASDLPYFREMIPHASAAGRLFRTGDAGSLAAAIKDYLRVSREERSAAARAEARKYPWARCVAPVAEWIGRRRLRILALAPNLWDGQWMNRQQLLSRLGSKHAVLYSSGAVSRYRPAGVEEPRWMPRCVARGAVRVDLLPSWMSRAMRRRMLSSLVRARIARRWRSLLDGHANTPLIVWCFHPKFWPFISYLSADYVIYHAYDLYHRQKRWTPELAEMERQLLARADLVIASSAPIAEYLTSIGGREVLAVENAADYDAFAIDPPDQEPADLAAVPHPRIGYTGTLNAKVDFPLLARLAARHPDWNIVLIGGLGTLDDDTEAAIQQLRRLANVRFLGFKSHTQLPFYVAAMDVNLLAYRISPELWTEGIYPLKLHEYLAAGAPVVGADLPSLRPFGEVVHIVSNDGEWESAIGAALDGRGVGTRDARRAVARENSWDGRVRLLERQLGLLTSTSTLPTTVPSSAAAPSERRPANPTTDESREAQRELSGLAGPSSAR